MLQQIIIKNFQKHRSLTVDFTEGVNLIMAPSDKGKTSILRGVDWVFRNRPLKFDSIRYDPKIAKDGGKPLNKKDVTSAEMVFNNGWIRRERNEQKINQYVLSGHDDPFSALKGEVPDEVRLFLNLDENFSIQMQDDPYFLIQSPKWTSGEVAKWLNEVSGFQIADQSMANIKVIARETKRDLDKSLEEIKVAEERIEELRGYESAGDLIKTIDDNIKEKDEIGQKCSQLSSLLDSFEDLQNATNELDDWLKVEESYIAVSTLVDEYGLLLEKKNGLTSLLDGLAEIELRIEDREEFLKIEPAVEKLLGMIGKYKDLSKKRGQVSSMLGSLEKWEKRMTEVDTEVKKKTKRYDKLLVDAGMCPTCGQVILEDHEC